ncbi:MAG: putative metal-binding motif-containing protein [Polyangiaceae bacterium]|nr:putative metal-binding motif-containing protein [Polyangiaceae bacterium]
MSLLGEQPGQLGAGQALGRHEPSMPRTARSARAGTGRVGWSPTRFGSTIAGMWRSGPGFGLVLAATVGSCGKPGVAGRLWGDGGRAGEKSEGGYSGMFVAPPTGGLEIDPAIGVPCTADAQCDDGFECTRDLCDAQIQRCRNEPDDTKCNDGQYCNGVERCEPRIGCRAGEPAACSDNNACTIDSCDEAARECVHRPRDADSDGDPDGYCVAGADCDDRDPSVSSLLPEVCGNGKDDDCDGSIDEPDCSPVGHDVCADALELGESGTFPLTFGGAGDDYAATCAGAGWRDLVVALVLERSRSVDLSVMGDAAVALSVSSLCGDPAGELACAAGFPSLRGGEIARLRLYEVAPGSLPITVFNEGTAPVSLEIELGDPGPAPDHETCGTATALTPGVPVAVPLVGAEPDVVASCPDWGSDLVYFFDLAEARDVEAFASATDGFGEPMVAILRDPCASLADEYACARGLPAVARARSLPPGRYYVAVSASAPSDLTLVVDTWAPTTTTTGETCADPLSLELGARQGIDPGAASDDLDLVCAERGVDNVLEIDVPELVDLLTLLRLSEGDTGAVGVFEAGCAGAPLICASGRESPVRALARDIGRGTYSVVVESQDGIPVEVTVLSHPARAPLLVAFSDTCDDATAVPPSGGAFFGNTVGATNDYSASCDYGRPNGSGAPDQILSLSLEDRRRIVIDAAASGFSTVIGMRRGPDCPGEELPLACSAGYGPGRSFLDLVVDPGEYWIQVDGYDGASGAWALDVFVAPP